MLTSRFGAFERNSKWNQHVRFFQARRALPPDEPDFYNKDYLRIFSRDVLMKIRNDDCSWEAMVPPTVANLIKERHFFGYRHQ